MRTDPQAERARASEATGANAPPIPPKTLRMARALLALWIMDCERTGDWPSGEKIDRAWDVYSQWMRDAWVERAESVLRYVGPRSA